MLIYSALKKLLLTKKCHKCENEGFCTKVIANTKTPKFSNFHGLGRFGQQIFLYEAKILN